MRSVNFMDQGAARYVTGEITSFDQKNEMFKRPWWDPAMADLGQKFYHSPAMPKDKRGYRLTDFSLVNASWRLDKEFAQGGRGGGVGLYDWQWDGKFGFPRVPPGLTVDANNRHRNSQLIKKAAAFFGAALTGICRLDRRWIYSPAYNLTPKGWKSVDNQIPDSFRFAIAIAVEMDYEMIQSSPAAPASAATGLGYTQMASVAGMLALFIRGLGFHAIPCGNDTACSIPVAIDAGLGEIARNGLLITPEYGPRVRLAKVFTDLPLELDRPIEFGVWAFCRICKKCAKKCPSKSIMFSEPTPKIHNISNRKGVRAWHIDAESCLSFWARNGTDCSNCIRSCPFNKPAGKFHDLVRFGVNRTPRLNPLFLWGDEVFGYSRKTSPGIA